MNNQRKKKINIQSPTGKNDARYETGGLRSFSRLLIGTIGLGLEELSERLDKWEESTEDSDYSNQNEQELPGNALRKFAIHRENIKSDRFDENFQYALIGLLIDSQDRLEASSRRLQPISNTINRFTRPFINTFSRLPLISPLRTGYSTLIEKGEDELNRLILLGRLEYEKSHQIAEIAIDDTFDEAVDYLATNQEIQELIQSQGVGLAGEVVEEIRERAVSADNFIDSIIRPLMKRKSRSEIPPPQFEKNQAKTRSK
jgi:hypothetical protein